MNIDPTLVVRVLSRMLPARDREIILADLWEESAHTSRRRSWVATQTLRMSAYLHLECYRDPRDATKVIVLLLTCACLALAIRAAGLGPADGARFFTDPVTRGLLAFWRASQITSALATGLILGRMTLPAHLSLARWHIAGAISVMFFSLYSAPAGATGGAVLLAATCLADRARRHGEDATDETRPANS